MTETTRVDRPQEARPPSGSTLFVVCLLTCVLLLTLFYACGLGIVVLHVMVPPLLFKIGMVI